VSRPRLTALATAGLLAAGLAGRTGRLLPGEEAAFRVVNDAPDRWRTPVVGVMQAGNGLMALAGPAAARALGASPRRQLAVGLAAFGGWQVAKGVKAVVRRGRPTAFFDDVHLRDGDPDGHGLVSGHATVAAATAVVLTPVLPGPARPVAAGVVLAVAAARVYVGAHLPLDALGGVALGVLVGQLADAWASIGPG
jgi:undecaprenyl-diphosphatase